MSAFESALNAVYDFENLSDPNGRVSRTDIAEYVNAFDKSDPPKHSTTAIAWDLCRTLGQREGRRALLYASRRWDETPLTPRQVVKFNWDDYEPQAWVDEYLVEVIDSWREAKEIAKARMARLEAENSQLSERLEERKVVDRAKGILQRELGLSEEEAYVTIQRQSRQRRKSKKEIAEAIIIGEEVRLGRDNG